MSNKMLIIGSIIVAVGLLFFAKWYSGGIAQTAGTHASSYAGIGDGAHAGFRDTGAQSAPDFSLQKLGGGTISVSEFKGKKPVVVDFWASWCPNCRRDMPNLNRYYEKYKDRVEVIGVNLQENEGTVKDFIASRGFSFPIALDPFGQASGAFGIQYTNTHFLIDKNGNLVRTIPGDISESDIASLLQ